MQIDHRELGLFLERLISEIEWSDVSRPLHAAISSPLIDGRGELDFGTAEKALDLWVRGKEWADSQNDDAEVDDGETDYDDWDEAEGCEVGPSDRFETFTQTIEMT